MPGLTADPKTTIRDLVVANWDNANTSVNYDPEFHTGWVNRSLNKPQVTFTNPNEAPVGGGDTGFFGIDPTGAGPIKRVLGRLQVTCWSDRNMESSVNPKQLTYEFSEEVNRIIKDNLFTAGGGIDWVSATSRTERVDTNADPPLFRYEVEVRYQYTDRP